LDVLCSDKTGTLTTGTMSIDRSIDPFGNLSQRALELAYLNSKFETGVRSPFDEVILRQSPPKTGDYTKCDEIPFDFERRRLSVVVERQSQRVLITKGAPEGIFPRRNEQCVLAPWSNGFVIKAPSCPKRVNRKEYLPVQGHRRQDQSGSIVSTTSSVGSVGSFSMPPEPVDPWQTLEYEIGMCFGALERLRSRPDLMGDIVLKNALVEDAVLHVRNLLEVFLDGAKKPTEIRLWNLFPDLKTDSSRKYAKLKSVKSRLRKLDRLYRGDFNQLVMHTTTLRGAYGDYEKHLMDLEPGTQSARF
jgi:hypothetical protein